MRENGGQYTHGAIWAAMAFAALGDSRRAWELLGMINPVNHSKSPEGIAIYKVEPYVVAADVYALPPHTGRGGWTWYTGSAGWMYRLIVESLLGLSWKWTSSVLLRASPRIGKGSRCTTGIARRSMKSTSGNNPGEGRTIVTVDGMEQQDEAIPLLTTAGTDRSRSWSPDGG